MTKDDALEAIASAKDFHDATLHAGRIIGSYGLSLEETTQMILDAYERVETTNSKRREEWRARKSDAPRVAKDGWETGRRIYEKSQEHYQRGVEEAIALLPDLPDLPETLRRFTVKECLVTGAEPYIVKGLIAPDDLGFMLAMPGHGKILAALLAGYRVAQGEPVSGCGLSRVRSSIWPRKTRRGSGGA